MRKVSEIRQALGKAVDELVALSEQGGADYDAKEKDVEALKAELQRTQRSLAAQAALAAPSEGRSLVMPARNGRLKYFKGERATERAMRFGRFIQASVFGSVKANEWCADNGIFISRAASEGVNSAGGFLVPDEFSTEIIDLRDAYGLFRRLCQVIPMGRDTLSTPRRKGGLTAYAVGEGTAPTASQMQWDNVRLTASKWAVLTLLSSELDEDAAVAIGDMLVGEIAYAFAVAEDTAGFSGDGSATYNGVQGILTLFNNQVSGGTSTYSGALDAASGHDTFAEIDSTDLANLMAKLPQYVYLRGNPTFYCSQAAWAAVFQRIIQGAGGISKDDITGRVVYRYLGFDVEIAPSMPTSTGDLSDKVMLMFGDLGMAAAMGDRRGMTVQRSTEYKFAEDQIALKGTERFDINIHDIGDTAAAGPVVALIGE